MPRFTVKGPDGGTQGHLLACVLFPLPPKTDKDDFLNVAFWREISGQTVGARRSLLTGLAWRILSWSLVEYGCFN